MNTAEVASQVPSTWAAVERELFVIGPQVLPLLRDIDQVLDGAGGSGRGDLSAHVAQSFINALRRREIATPLTEIVKRHLLVAKLKQEAADASV